MTTTTPAQIDAALDEATIKQLSFKIGTTTNICICVVQHLLRDKICWMDEIPLPVLNDDDKNCVGLSFRRLAKLGLIRRMEGAEDHRRSKVKSRKGGIVFKYRIGNEKLAETFLRKNNSTVFRRSVEELDLEQKRNETRGHLTHFRGDLAIRHEGDKAVLGEASRAWSGDAVK